MLERLIREIASDHSSGAAEILEKAPKLFESLSAETPQSTLFEVRHVTVEACVALIRSQPCMAPLINLAIAVIRAQAASSTTDEARRAATVAANDFLRGARQSSEVIQNLTSGLLADGQMVLTHSRSSTVAAALTTAHNAGRKLRVVVTESRPLFEGRALAAELAREGVDVTLIADSAAASLLTEVGCVLVGADCITPNALVNKIGTRMIALAARELGVPMYAAADSSKFLNPAGLSLLVEPGRAAEELWEGAPAAVNVLNRYFEETPLSYLTGIITESGLITSGDAAEHAEIAVIDPVLAGALNSSS
jgi:translation initiation factor 2B subunit (eIF-2B alpha/beta/delta family)